MKQTFRLQFSVTNRTIFARNNKAVVPYFSCHIRSLSGKGEVLSKIRFVVV